MASTQRLTITTPAWTIEKTTTYNTASPAASPAAFATTATAFDGVDLDSGSIVETAIGALITFDAAALPAAFVGVRVRATPTYTGAGRSLDLWTYNGTSWTRQTHVSISADQNDGVSSGSSRIFELWLDAPVTGVTKVWVTFTSTAVTNGGFCALHLYESRAETTTNPFDVATGQPFDTGADLRPRAATVAGVAGKTFCLAYQLDRTPDPADDTVDTDGGWSLLDLPAAACCQTTDEHGEDIIILAMNDLDNVGHGLVTLDWARYEDEYWWDQKTPIYRRWKFGPIPFIPDNDNTETTPRYELPILKRFRRLEGESRLAPTDATTTLRVTVEEFGVSSTARTQTYTTAKRLQVQVAVRGMQFAVLIEHAANEAWEPLWWKAAWDMLGPRIQQNAVA